MEKQRPNTDGRIARGERTRAAIIAAHTSLLRDGVLHPTAAAVAERAGVSVRTIWSNFKDREALLTQSTEFWLAEDDDLWLPIDPGLPLAERITTYCRQRARRLENIAPAARSAAIAERTSEVLRASRQRHLNRMREQVELVFAAELAGRDPWFLHAVVTTASWPSWSTLRDDYGLDVDLSTTVMHHTLTALFAS